MQETAGAMQRFRVLIGVWVTWIYALVQTAGIVQVTFVCATVRNFYQKIFNFFFKKAPGSV